MEKLLTPEEFQTRLDRLKNQRIPVLSHGGVTLVDVMGSDQRVVEAARTTSGIGGKGETEDRNLIRFLMRHQHGTPFEFPEVDLLLEIPMDAWRQLVRHRMASINEFSSRYSEVPDVNDVTTADRWRLQSRANRQGSSSEFVVEWPEGYRWVEADSSSEFGATHGRVERFDPVSDGWVLEAEGIANDPGEYLTFREYQTHHVSRETYIERLKFGVAKEQARKDLCLSTYTRVRWKSELRNVFHMLGLRMDSHAQLEIRMFANTIGTIVQELFPVCYQAFLDYEHNAIRLSALDQVVIRKLLAGRYIDPTTITPDMLVTNPGREARGKASLLPISAATLADFLEAQHDDWRDIKNCRERDECLVKLQKLGIVA